ncbi:MAG: FAD-dependent oxidoreductase [Paracoccaceae bacterium]|nr:FAD-dependent oxidoreductase [Paracoccaceae bacterium]
MPYEVRRSAPRRVAVIGGGISGMGAAHFLVDTDRVVLFEAAPRLGGHARTVIAGKNADQPVDTGFIVFNHATYPELLKMFDRLGVPTAKSDMGFGASIRGGWLEYGLRGMPAIFAQKKNLADPRYWRMLRDIMTFNREALAAADRPDMTIGDLIAKLGLGAWFRDYYLTPFSGAIWSTPTEKILDFPAKAMVQFFENHSLLSYSDDHQWYTVKGGSVEYVSRLTASLEARGADIRTGASVQAVRRTVTGVEVRVAGAEWESFDDVVFATHSDQTLAMLSDATGVERTALSAVTYQPNRAVLHADERMMPKRKACWSSWNYTEPKEKTTDRIGLTYWMNSLQPIPKSDPLFVTLNATQPIREELIYDEVTFAHPLYDLGALAAQETIRAINGSLNTWFCGAWMRNGFHEDGLRSALDVAEAMAMRTEMAIAAE